MKDAASFERTALNRFLGLRLLRAGGGEAEVAVPVRTEFVQEEGVIHGGILSTLADTCAVYALGADLLPGVRLASIEFKVNFFAAAHTPGADLLGSARVLHRGRSTGVCEARVTQDGRLLLTGLFTYLVRPMGGVAAE